MHQERMTEIHTAGLTSRPRARPIEGGVGNLRRDGSEERSRLAVRLEQPWNVQVRANQNLRGVSFSPTSLKRKSASNPRARLRTFTHHWPSTS